MKTEDRDIAIETQLILFGGEISVTEKVILKMELMIFEY